MPAKNTLKTYLENSYYHIYNRGINRMEIFPDEEDCIVFLYCLKLYLSPPDILKKEEKFLSPRFTYKLNNLSLYQNVSLISFALMPNHFHIQIKQKDHDAIQKLMKRVLTTYVQFFNRKYKRRGPLFESVYKAVLILSEEQLLHLTSYIHRNPMKLKTPKFDFVQFSSYPYYLGEKVAAWLNTNEVLEYFKKSRNPDDNGAESYKNFVNDFREIPEEILGTLIIEED